MFTVFLLCESNMNSIKTKPVFSNAQIEHLAQTFKILSEPSRLKILSAIIQGEKCVTDIIEITGLNQPNVSKQLSIMQKSGIIECRPCGLMKYYKLLDYSILQICDSVCNSDRYDDTVFNLPKK